MFFIYQIIIFLIIIFSPIILVFRFFKNKEDKKRFIEKFTFITKKRKNKDNLIWIHAASVGELMSVIPLVKKLEKRKNIKTILITTSTLSSSKIFKNYKFKKTIHQFFPIDFYYFTARFIKYWKPKIAIFIDSEIWPSMYREISKKSIPLVLMNARITKKSFLRWRFFNKFTKNIFELIDVSYPSNTETKKYLKELKVKKIKKVGNLKFTELKSQKVNNFSNSFLKSINKRLVWCASSTHPGEEKIIAKTHLSLKKKFNNLLTIIIPRHTQRIIEIDEQIKLLGLKTIVRTSNTIINNETDIYLVDTYGETKKFFSISKIAFIGGSLVNHGGQNPIEPARFQLSILHGPYVDNFKDIYKLFDKKKIAHKITNTNQLQTIVEKLLRVKKKKKIDLDKIGNVVLKESVVEIINIFENEIKKA